MIIKKNKNGTFDLQGITTGKLMAIVSAINDLEELHEKNRISSVQADVRDLIKNSPIYQEAIKIGL